VSGLLSRAMDIGLWMIVKIAKKGLEKSKIKQKMQYDGKPNTILHTTK
jgi:hypothetical protein